MPIRIQRRRTTGWRMPPNAIYVGRPTVFGNPLRAGTLTSIGDDGFLLPMRTHQVVRDRAHAVLLYRAAWQSGELLGLLPRVELPHLPVPDSWDLSDLADMLRGRDLCCWCPLDRECHADVLLEVANR